MDMEQNDVLLARAGDALHRVAREFSVQEEQSLVYLGFLLREALQFLTDEQKAQCVARAQQALLGYSYCETGKDQTEEGR